ALRARLRADELAEHAARHLLQPAGAVAAVAADGRRPGLDPIAVAARAHHGKLERNRRSRAARRVDEIDLDLCRHVRPTSPSSAAAHSGTEDVVAEEGAEQIAEAADVEVRRCETARPQARVAVAVVERAGLGVGEHLVRLRHLAEALLRLGLVGHVGVQLPRQSPERLLDRLFVCVARDPEQFVVVPAGAHSEYTSSTKRDSSYAAARTERSAFS